MNERQPTAGLSHAFLEGGGEVARIIASRDWSTSPLGPLEGWSKTLTGTIALILQSPVPIVTLWGVDGVMLYNDAYSVFAGGRHPQLLGSKVREGWSEIADFNDNVMKVVLAGRTLRYEDQELTLHRHGRGEQVWMNLDYSPIRDEQGVPIAVIAIVVETTAKVRAERAVHESEEKFRTFAQAMPNQVWSARRDGELDWFNDRVYEYSGAAQGSLDGQAWSEIIHRDHVEAAAGQWAHAVASGTTYECEFRIRRADGVFRWHIARALPIRDNAGRIVRWIGTNTDIEDQKSTARALERLNKTLEQQVAESVADRDRMWRLSTDMMLVADFQSNIVAVNPAWRQILGWDEKNLIGHSFLEFVHPDDRIETLAELGELSEGIRTFKFVNRYQRQDGAYVTLSWTAVPDDRFIHAVGRDITADREAADALRRTELALQQAQKMETIGKLTGGVAHDFNNLLQVISGNLQLLATDVTGSERAERRLANALAGVSRGAKLASQLLAFGRRQALEPKTIRIGRLITGMEDMLRRSLGEAIEIETVVSAGLWNTFVDPTQVENAVLNLAINARDAMDNTGKLTLEVGNAFLDDRYALEHAEVTAGQYVMLAVTDTGCGMTPEVLAQAYEPFFSTKPEGKGSGLGLSMVYGFVKQSGGHVKIYSEPGLGTTVKLYLPRTHDKEDLGTVMESTPVLGGAETILVAEDDEQVRATVVETLSDLGYRVLKANDANSALAIIESGVSIDLLFTDVVMPGPLRSPELARRARQLIPGIAVLFTSGYTENSIVHGGRLDAGVELLGKPYTREALARKIRHVLANQTQHAALTVAAAPSSVPSAVTLSAPAGRALNILFVEDDDLIRSNTGELLMALGHVVHEAANAQAALALIQKVAVDLLITDVGLPGMSGEELALQARVLRCDLAVIFATGDHHVSKVSGYFVLRKPYDTVSMAAVLRQVQ